METWIPSAKIKAEANISLWLSSLNLDDIHALQQWSYTHYQDFWQKIIVTLPIVFKTEPSAICDLAQGVINPRWLPNAKMNIIDSCLNTNKQYCAFIYYDSNNNLVHMTYAELTELVARISNSLLHQGFKPGDAIAIIMPMTVLACAIYLAIINIGAVVVSIADSFSSAEMATRLQLANTKAIFTQENIRWGEKTLPLYEKVRAAFAELIIVVPEFLDAFDVAPSWQNFLLDNKQFTSYACDPMAACNILFSSGTTGQPKAIPWNHTTAIKAASDAYFHQNIKAQDVLAWPTNLGWMMGPWLLFAGLINHATIALYSQSPKERAYGEFIQAAQVTMLGVVPTLVAAWKDSQCMQGLNFNSIKVFSSSGECSNENDMQYLMALGGGKPIIEYCGGTEIGGAYLSSTVIQENIPAQFSTPTMGTRMLIINTQGIKVKQGEVALVPPILGLSTTLLNANHYHEYYDQMPKAADGSILRRHGDLIEQLANGYYRMLGRADDTMNLGGIKVSAAEIERSVNGIEHILELAAVAVTNAAGGLNQLIIFAATTADLDKTQIQKEMQKRINQQLNPLFKIHEVVFMRELPKTASNKIMRRILRDQYKAL